MPVIPQIPRAIKIGQNFVPASAQKFGLNQAQSQKSLTKPVLFRKGINVIKYPVIGASITAVMLKLLAIQGEKASIVSGIIAKMKAKYDKDYAAAAATRAKAQTKLFNDLVAKKEKIVTDLKKSTDEIEKLKQKISEQTIEKDREYAKYHATVFDYAYHAKELDAAGKKDESQVYIDKITDMDHWLGDITLMMTNIINLKLELKYAQTSSDVLQKLVDTEIPNNWKIDCNLALDFEVAIPYYPDLPMPPQFPTMPQAPNIPPKVRTLMIQMAKWMVCPLFSPIGVGLSATLLMIKERAPNSPISSATQDSKIDALIPKMAGGF